ncbi:hypothetical protein F2Q70_00027111 [Brassica cretica]|nr:hypothetical protein F2Q68_00026635 [Brassica cretica]KAF2602058.1 hypothetical protein F2Q70_00027111 [Brassica cretica]
MMLTIDSEGSEYGSWKLMYAMRISMKMNINIRWYSRRCARCECDDRKDDGRNAAPKKLLIQMIKSKLELFRKLKKGK